MKKNSPFLKLFLLTLLFFSAAAGKSPAQARYVLKSEDETNSAKFLTPVHNEIPLTLSCYNDETADMECSQIPESYFNKMEKPLISGFYKGVMWIDAEFTDTSALDGKMYNIDFGTKHIDLAELYIKNGEEWQFYGRTGRSIRRQMMSYPLWRLNIPMNLHDFPQEETHHIRLKLYSYFGHAN